jgi:hypothetical protein
VNLLATSGDRPGTAPGRLYVAARGPALPVRITQTGPNRAGRTGDPLCDDPDGKNDTTRSDVRLSRFDVPVHIIAPADYLDLEKLIADQKGQSSA